MSRPIKFRVWHKGRNEWVHGPGFEPNLFGEVILLGAFLRHSIEELNDYVPLQFSGLTAQSGQEVYEGDIFNTKAARWVVEFVDGEFVGRVVWSQVFQVGKCLPLKPLLGHSVMLGNMYENPELLKT